MKYFFLNQSVEKKIIGKFPQSSWMSTGSDFTLMNIKMEYAWERGEDWNKVFKNQKVELAISQSTKLTSLLYCENIIRGIVILSNCFDIIKEFNLPKFITIPAKLFLQKKKPIESNYLWLNIEPIELELIDFEKTTFFLKEYIGEVTVEEIKFSDGEELMEFTRSRLYETITFLRPKELFFKNEFDYDLFRFDSFERGRYLVSEKLKNKMIEEGFTGMEFREPKDFKIIKQDPIF